MPHLPSLILILISVFIQLGHDVFRRIYREHNGVCGISRSPHHNLSSLPGITCNILLVKVLLKSLGKILEHSNQSQLLFPHRAYKQFVLEWPGMQFLRASV